MSNFIEIPPSFRSHFHGIKESSFKKGNGFRAKKRVIFQRNGLEFCGVQVKGSLEKNSYLTLQENDPTYNISSRWLRVGNSDDTGKNIPENYSATKHAWGLVGLSESSLAILESVTFTCDATTRLSVLNTAHMGPSIDYLVKNSKDINLVSWIESIYVVVLRMASELLSNGIIYDDPNFGNVVLHTNGQFVAPLLIDFSNKKKRSTTDIEYKVASLLMRI
ncbi:MAG: hypothetical protein GW942_01340 [Candidatus Pacebacteria bacterium]|nr:hypothetical protein [Candidatus Paceibacterota bacterium]